MQLAHSAGKSRNVIPVGSAYISLTANEINSGQYDLEDLRIYRAYKICEELGYQTLEEALEGDVEVSYLHPRVALRELAPRFKVVDYKGDHIDFYIAIPDYSRFFGASRRHSLVERKDHEVFEKLYCKVGAAGDPGERSCCRKCHECKCSVKCGCGRRKSD